MTTKTEKKKSEEPTGKDGKDGGKGTDHEAEAAKWKALARKHEAQAKANADAAKKLEEIEDADKSEIERAAKKAAEAEKRAEEAELRALRLEVAADKGLTPAQAKRLVGATKEEIEADADELLETFAPAKKSEGEEEEEGKSGPGGTPEPKRRPTEDLKAGATSTGEPDDEPEKIAEKILERRKI